MQMQGFRKGAGAAALVLAVAALFGSPPARAQTGTSASGPASGKPDPVCASYGPGFARLPGSSTCVKISGGVQADIYSTDASVSGGSGALAPALKSK